MTKIDMNAVGGPHAGSVAPLRVEQGPRSKVTRLCDVSPQAVRWMWRGWIPLGMLTVLDGDPGLGKSTLTLDLAARLSRGGAMPDGSSGPEAAGVVILSAEDDLARTIRPRLDSADADVRRVVTVHVERGGELCDPTLSSEDLSAVERAIVQTNAGLLVVDPLMAYLPADVNAHRDQDVRRSLSILRALAERTGAAVLVIRHLNKNGIANALYRGGGSIGIVGAARASLLLAADPDDPTSESRVLAVPKANLALKPASLKLRLVAEPGTEHPRVHWDGESRHTATTLLADQVYPEQRKRAEVLERQVEARALKIDCAVAALKGRVTEWAAAGTPVRRREDAVELMKDFGVSRDSARELITERVGRDWVVTGTGLKGDPERLLPVQNSGGSATYRMTPPESSGSESSLQTQSGTAPIPADRVHGAPPESTLAEAAMDAPETAPRILAAAGRTLAAADMGQSA